MGFRERRNEWLRAVAILVMAIVLGHPESGRAQQTAGFGTEAGSPRFRLLRSVSGTDGSIENGRFVVADPRTVFYVPGDKQLVFYFEWEGPAGRHRLEGVWTDPTGKVASVSAFDYEATERRFGGQWSLPVVTNMALGIWNFDVRIDGESAGRHAFQIVEGEKPAGLPVAPRTLTAAEAYRRLQAAAVHVEAFDEAGDLVGSGLGFAVADGQLVAAFETIDGAASARITFAGGNAVTVQSLAACHRWQNWALFRLPTAGLSVLPKPPARGWQVGDKAYSLVLSDDGATTIAEATILGTARLASVGERVTISEPGLRRSAGAPVLSEFGDLIGMVADQAVPGESTLARSISGPSVGDALATKPGVYVVPVEVFAPATERNAAVSFGQLARDGTFTSRLGPGRVHIGRATTARGVQKDRDWIDPVSESAVFPRSAPSFAVVLNLRPRAKLRLLASCQVLDSTGRKVSTRRSSPRTPRTRGRRGSSCR
jgi:hypothetical protein